MIATILPWFFCLNMLTQQVHAPELVRGEMVSVEVSGHKMGYVDGGDVQLIMIGERVEDVETGYFYRVGGGHIDNDDEPVPYEVVWRNEHKYIGFVFYRMKNRKLCAANKKENLPCK
ncbi:MAG: hypothetical protein HN390_16690 [Anaerolineae bacterium]|jgi:hypothetical protein|nr:hypothetical protein [Anaerolineae bacterium]MBT7192109.1 hypothetical protein [Anaerolineae bacterium]